MSNLCRISKLVSSTLALISGGSGSGSAFLPVAIKRSIFVSSASFASGFTAVHRHCSHHRRKLYRHTFSGSTSTTMSATGRYGGKNLISIEEAIDAYKNDPKAVFIDGSWHMPVPSPTTGKIRNGRKEYLQGPRIAGAKYFDIDDISLPKNYALKAKNDKDASVSGYIVKRDATNSDNGDDAATWVSNPKSLPHNMPPKLLFAHAMDQLGISQNNNLYVYSTSNCAFVHRAYYTLRNCGHDPNKVKLIQGSLDEWRESGGVLDTEALTDGADLFRMENVDWETSSPPKYLCLHGGDDSDKAKQIVSMDEVLDIIQQKKTSNSNEIGPIIIDARSSGRFYGTAPEPRPGLRGGHIPNSINVPFLSLLQNDDVTKFKSSQELRDIFQSAGVVNGDDNDNRQQIVCTCGSGVTAAAIAVALEECGLRSQEDVYIFDGSWIEWGGDDNTPVVTKDI